MKRLSCITLLGASIFLFSCGDDAPSAGALPEKFSSQTVEENKAQLEDNGIKLLNSLEGLRDSDGIKTSASLVSLFNSMGQTSSTPGGRLINSMSNLRTDSKSATKVFSAMRLEGANSGSIQEFFDTNAGTYSWKSAAQEWDTVAGGSSIIFKFPAVEGGTSNNATLTIGGYEGITTTINAETVELPKKLAMDMTVNGNTVIVYSFNATYNGSQDPTSMVSKLILAPYVFEVNFSNTTTAVEANYSLRNGSETLIAAGGSSTGKYSFEAMEGPNENEIIESASAYFQVYNIKIAGNVNAKNIAAGMEVIYPADFWNDPDFDENEATKKQVQLLNDNYNLVVFYVDSNEKIADTEFYTYESSWNPEYLTMDMRFVFGDGSPVDFETYFSTGFSDIEAEFTSFYEAF